MYVPGARWAAFGSRGIIHHNMLYNILYNKILHSVRAGGSMGCFRKPKKAPARTSGTEMPSHMQSSAKSVPGGEDGGG